VQAKSSSLKTLAKRLAHLALGEYSVYYIYTCSGESTPTPHADPALRVEPVDGATIRASADPEIRDQAGHTGAGAYAHGCFEGERLICVCFCWHGERYQGHDFWPLHDDEAWVEHIYALPGARGRGVAAAVFADFSRDLLDKGFARLYCRIWHSNVPSWRAIERAGWRRVALVVEINPLRRRRAIRLRRRLGAQAQPR